MTQSPQETHSQTKTVINLEEARTELQATLAAGRELGPEMDETLAARYVERLDTLFPDPTRDSTRLRSEVEALIASARGHGPDADPARAKDFVARALAPHPTAPVPVAPAGPLARRDMALANYIPMIVAAAVFIALLIATQGQVWWLIFIFPGMFFWGRGGRRGRQRMRARRYGYWDGYGPTMPGPSDPNRQLPPGDHPEML